MAKTLRLLLAAVALVAFGRAAQADVLVEPYLGFHAGRYKEGSNSTRTTSGPTFGARLGYKNITGLMLGLDGMTGKLKDDSSPANDVTPTQVGLFVGFEFPILLRAYASYALLMNEVEVKGNSTTTVDNGSTLKFGLGFTALPLLAINLEYITSSFKDRTVNGSSSKVDTTASYYGLSLSLPLAF